jgi:SAM-dependent methyltransferase/MFS family permease
LVHPKAVRVAAEFDVDLSSARPGGYERIRGLPDLIVSVCDRVLEGGVPAGRSHVHWSILDPVAVGTLPIAPNELWKPTGTEDPIVWILLLLGASVGLPYFLLAANSPLLQAWFARARPGENPYRLFAVSNLGSLVALLGYPFLVEPYLGGGGQVRLWSWLFAAFAVLCAVVAWRTPRVHASLEAEETTVSPIPKRDVVLWLALSATGSMLLLAVTNHLTQNVAAMPLLWLAPLTLYLLTFIIAFDGRDWYRPRIVWPFVLVWLAGMAWILVDADYHYDLPMQLGIFLPGLFLGCLFCHGELYRLRPAPAHLTRFYLIVSAGGALGGLLVAVVAPVAFDAYYELGIGMTVLAILAALRFAQLGRIAHVASLAVLLGVTACAAYDAFHYHRDVRVSERGFYGVLRVKEYGSPGEPSHLRRLVHGTIMHGEQYLHEDRRRFITTYYQESSGIGLAIQSRQERGPIRVGVIGLGTGTIAAYGRKGDLYRFYDIDPRVVKLARQEFTYLADSAATIEVALGDARLTLEREPPQHFDVLAVDAFSSDAIPVHLITREALAVYLKHVKPDGIVAFHVSNRFLDLVPVVGRLAREHGVHVVLVRDDPDEEADHKRSRTDWVLVSRDAAALKRQAIVEREPVEPEERPHWRTWTDDYSNLIQILK